MIAYDLESRMNQGFFEAERTAAIQERQYLEEVAAALSEYERGLEGLATRVDEDLQELAQGISQEDAQVEAGAEEQVEADAEEQVEAEAEDTEDTSSSESSSGDPGFFWEQPAKRARN